MPESFLRLTLRGNSMFTIRTSALAVGALLTGLSAHTAVTAAEGSSPARAVIASVAGSALVSTQSEIVPALAGMELEPLNRLFVLENGQAVVTFSDGCEKDLAENEMLTIGAETGCEAAHIERSATAQAVAAPAVTTGAFATAAAAPTSFTPLLFGAGGAGIGALGLTGVQAAAVAASAVVVGGVAVAATEGDNNNNNTAAPEPPPSPISPQ
jgi:hypothetical protein